MSALGEIFGAVELILKIANSIHSTVQKFKTCPQQIRKTIEVVDALTATLSQVHQNARINQEVLAKILKPVHSIVQRTQELVSKYEALVLNTSLLNKIKLMSSADKIYSELASQCEEMNKCIPSIQMAITLENNPARGIPDPDAQEFWLTYYCNSKKQPTYEDLMISLQFHFQNCNFALYKENQLFKAMLDPTNDGKVSLNEFSQFVLMFRPFKELPAQLKELDSLCSFHNFKTEDEFKDHMDAGQFCLKPSFGGAGMFSLWGRTKDGVSAKKLLHNLATAEEQKYLYDQNFATNKQKYRNLAEYIKANSDKLGTKCCEQQPKKSSVAVYCDSATPENIYDVGQIKLEDTSSSPEEEEGYFWTVSTPGSIGMSYFVILCKDSLVFYDDYDTPSSSYRILFKEISYITLVPKGFKITNGRTEWSLLIASSSLPLRWVQKISKFVTAAPSPALSRSRISGGLTRPY